MHAEQTLNYSLRGDAPSDIIHEYIVFWIISQRSGRYCGELQGWSIVESTSVEIVAQVFNYLWVRKLHGQTQIPFLTVNYLKAA